MFAAILDHVQRAISRLIQIFRGSQSVANKIGSSANEAQDIETAVVDLFNNRDPATAEDDQLDQIGRLVVARDRSGQTDAEYRKRVGAAVTRNKSQGQVGDIYELLLKLHPTWIGTAERFVKQDEGASHIHDSVFECGSIAILDGDTDGLIDVETAHETARYLRDTAAAGVRSILKFRTPDNTAGLAFSFSGTGEELGFDDGSGTVGGKFTDAFEK